MTIKKLAYLIDDDDYLIECSPSSTSIVDADYPISNLTTLPISEPARFTGFSTTILIDLGSSSKPVSIVALIAHNISETASITVFAGTTVACNNYSTSITWRDRTAFKYLSTAQSYRYWQIIVVDYANLDGQIDIGRLMMGPAALLERTFYGQTRQRIHVNDGAVSEFGSEHFARVYHTTRLTFPMPHLIASEMNAVIAMVNACEGSLTPLLIIPDTVGVDAYFGRFVVDPNELIEYYRSTDLEFVETSPGRWIKELQPFVWAVGQDLPTYEMTRAGAANYFNSRMILVSGLSDIPRDDHHPDSAKRALLLEEGRSNNIIASNDFNSEAWIKNGVTISSDATTGPDNNNMADKMIENLSGSISHNVSQIVTGLTQNTTQSFSIFAKAAERSWCILLTYTKAAEWRSSYFNLSTGLWGTTSAYHKLKASLCYNGWYRLECSYDVGSGSYTPQIAFGLTSADNVSSYTGDGISGIYIGCAQLEKYEFFPSSYMLTPTMSGLRNNETLWFDYDELPQQSTLYTKFVETGSIYTEGAGVLHMGRSDNAAAKFQVIMSSGYYTALHNNGASFVFSRLGAAPSIGDIVELRGKFYSDGAVQIAQSINGATETEGSKSAVLSPASSGWGAERLYFNSTGNYNRGVINFLSVKHVRGIQPLIVCRNVTQ